MSNLWNIPRELRNLILSYTLETFLFTTNDNVIHVLSRVDVQHQLSLEGHQDLVHCLTVLGDGRIASGSDDRTIKIWVPGTARCMATLRGHTSGIRSLAPVDGGKWLLSGSLDHLAKVWDVASIDGGDGGDDHRCVGTLEGHTWSVSAVAVRVVRRMPSVAASAAASASASEDREIQFVTGSWDAQVKIWNGRFDCVATLKGHEKSISCLATLDGGYVVSGSDDGTIKIWDPDSADLCRVTLSHDGWVNCVAALSKTRFVSGGADRSIRVWECRTRRDVQIASSDSTTESKSELSVHGWTLSIDAHEHGVRWLVVLDNGQLLSGGVNDSWIKVWEQCQLSEQSELRLPHEPLACLALMADSSDWPSSNNLSKRREGRACSNDLMDAFCFKSRVKLF